MNRPDFTEPRWRTCFAGTRAASPHTDFDRMTAVMPADVDRVLSFSEYTPCGFYVALVQLKAGPYALLREGLWSYVSSALSDLINLCGTQTLERLTTPQLKSEHPDLWLSMQAELTERAMRHLKG